MARFNAAKMIGAVDQFFQTKYNQLIDLLDSGYIVEKTVNGKHVKIFVDPTHIIQVEIDGVKVFGITSDGRIFIQSMGNPADETNYIKIEDTGSGQELQFYGAISGYPSVRRCRMITLGSTVFWIYTTPSTTPDADGVTSLFLSNGKANLILSEKLDICELEWDTQDNAVGVDSTAPYYTQGGDKKYLEEQNAFTPVIYGASTAGTPTYSQQYGYYYVVGDLVYFDIDVIVTNLGGMAGDLKINGLPFDMKNDTQRYPCFTIGSLTNATYPAGANQLVAKGIPNTDEIFLSWIKSGTSMANVNVGDIVATFGIRISGTYVRV